MDDVMPSREMPVLEPDGIECGDRDPRPESNLRCQLRPGHSEFHHAADEHGFCNWF